MKFFLVLTSVLCFSCRDLHENLPPPLGVVNDASDYSESCQLHPPPNMEGRHQELVKEAEEARQAAMASLREKYGLNPVKFSHLISGKRFNPNEENEKRVRVQGKVGMLRAITAWDVSSSKPSANLSFELL